jgi:intron-binding protein aquarius
LNYIDILLSLVRTKAVGHIRDIRRLIVAMSRAKFGLYVFCNKALFENCYELEPVMKQLNNRPCTLQLVDNEKYPSERQADSIENVTEIANVEDLGQLVYKKSQEQLKSLQIEEAEKLSLEQQNESMDTDEE